MKTIPNAFASQNTTAGFRSFFPEIFNRDKLRKIIVLKGGPGTGKSYLMKAAATNWEEKGGTAERFSCSSDPDSLDAVLFPEIGAAILDGTSPHTFDAVYPGAVEEIFDTGAFWKTAQISQNAETIRHLVHTKRESVHSAELFLSGAGILFNGVSAIAKEALDQEKIRKAIDRYLKKEKLSSDPEKTSGIRLNESFNHHGLCRTAVFEKNAESVYFLKDEAFSASLFLNEFGKRLQEKKIFHIRSYSAIFPDRINALYLPENKAAWIAGDLKEFPAPSPCVFINMKRFLSEEILKKNRLKIRYLKKSANFLVSEAKDSFLSAREAHLRLEKLYTSAMNFEKMNLSFQKRISFLN